MQTKGINLSEKRSFSDEFTTTFLFMKQECKSLIVAFLVIVLPLIFVELFLQSIFLKDTMGVAGGNILENGRMTTLLVNYLISIIVFIWLQLFVLAYLRIYTDKYPLQEKVKISFREVLRLMWHNLGKFFGLNLVYLLIVVLGCFLFVVPGIYVAVILVFSSYFLMIRDKKMTSAFADSVELCHGQWWSLFGYLVLFYLIVTMLSYIFNLPYLIIALKTYVSGDHPGLFGLTLVTFIGQLGRYLMNIILTVGIGVRFFSSLERKEHKTLLDKIGQIGSEEQTERSEN